MGDKYFFDRPCPRCGATIKYCYAESCEMTTARCDKCGAKYYITLGFSLIGSSPEPSKPAPLPADIKSSLDRMYPLLAYGMESRAEKWGKDFAKSEAELDRMAIATIYAALQPKRVNEIEP